MFTKNDLRVGDVCITRCGITMIAQPHLNSFICISGWTDMYNYNEKLENVHGRDYDIVRVFRPEHGSQCSFSRYAYSTAEIVYEEPTSIGEDIALGICQAIGSSEWITDKWGSYVRHCASCSYRPGYSEKYKGPHYTKYCPACGKLMLNYKELI